MSLRVLALACAAASAIGQEPIHRFTGAAPVEQLGAAVAAAGDIDGDGTPDLIIGAPGAAGLALGRGRAPVYSGRTGATLLRLLAVGPERELGAAVSGLGDVDGDGIPDLLVGAPKTLAEDGRVVVFSGFDGARLLVLSGDSFEEGQFGAAVAGMGDLDGDGVPDFAVGAPYAEATGDFLARGEVSVHSGSSGALLWSRLGEPLEANGYSLAALDDLDGDGLRDLAVGAPDAMGLRGVVRVRSGADGALLFELVGPTSNGQYGRSVAAVGDLDGDGVGDLAVGAPAEDGAAGPRAGRARTYSGASGALLHTVEGARPFTLLGVDLDGIGDVDGDGTPDWIVGAPDVSFPVKPGSAQIVSGADGSLLRVIAGEGPREQLGFAVAGVGDIDGDGDTDVLLGAPAAGAGGTFVGEARAYSALPFDPFCTSTPNSTGSPALISADGTSSLTRDDLVLEAAPVPDEPGLFCYGARQVELPFGNGLLCVGGELHRLPVTAASAGVLRSAVDYGSFPAAGAITVGSVWNFQAWFRDPAAGGASFDTSNGLEVWFEP